MVIAIPITPPAGPRRKRLLAPIRDPAAEWDRVVSTCRGCHG
ncbi:hypothetical protein DB31_2955 [Hyalangium minutum]|uniref:Uncharacterized protein n=1 Tax=Hyalangium minutum TaxID=394096 RepID=A0A085W5D3_9BACT|nr:hypothetical protein DB31_2955 [Hyalangium minutum]